MFSLVVEAVSFSCFFEFLAGSRSFLRVLRSLEDVFDDGTVELEGREACGAGGSHIAGQAGMAWVACAGRRAGLLGQGICIR